MSLKLAYISIKLVYATLVGRRSRTLVTSCPLAEQSSAIAIVMKYLRQNFMCRVVWLLSYNGIVYIIGIHHSLAIRPILLIATHMSMARMLSSHKCGTRRSRYWRACICLCKAHTLACHAVDIGCRDKGLTIACKVAISHIVAHYEYNVGALLVVLLPLYSLGCEQCWDAHQSS